MTEKEQRQAARQFAADWAKRGNEKGDTQAFWLALLQKVYGADDPNSAVLFERKVQIDGTAHWIDAYLPGVRVLVEQKDSGVRLEASRRTGAPPKLTPYGQAKRYDDNLPLSEKARWVIVCNFRRFLVYDMERPDQPPSDVSLESLAKDPRLLDFLVDGKSSGPSDHGPLSLKAGELVGVLYDELLKSYGNSEPNTLQHLNMLIVRLVFCLYAEDSGLFGRRNAFRSYLSHYPPEDLRNALQRLFEVLDTPPDRRDPYLEESLAAFPYVNGGLFARRDALIPPFSETLKELLERRASADLDWSTISPAIFGAVFESTLNPESRRSGGMHYTSLENIHKVIDPLFLDGLREELRQARTLPHGRRRESRLRQFQAKLASLVFLDPACGSGNFLTESYIALRELENEVLAELFAGQPEINLGDVIRVSIDQFRGIEINDFAVSVAGTALWIAESQMFRKAEDLLMGNGNFLPLKKCSGIVEGNALRMDWRPFLDAPAGGQAFILGNPPFVGARMMTPEQKNDLLAVFGPKWRNLGNLDYVCGWHRKAAGLMRGTGVRAAFVSTNSICQGGQVADLWQGLILQFGVHLDFAHRTFCWDSESKGKAHVHCVIVGFSCAPTPVPPFVFDGGRRIPCTHLNPYLIDAPDVFIASRQRPRCDVPEIGIGNKPIDGGFYLFTESEKAEFLKREPTAERFFRPWYGAEEFLNRTPRWCLWLGDCAPDELRSMPLCYERVRKVREYRLASPSGGTRRLADRPTRFHVENMPRGNYIVIPEVSSERREYIPIGFMGPECLCSNLVRIIPDATLYHFGVLTSSVHNAWTRAVCGRLEMRYRYSKDIVYNNFPWPEVGEARREAIAETAQGVLDARAQCPGASLADLYDPVTMPLALRQAHHRNDHAVLAAYGFQPSLTEAQIVAELFRM
ncbi:MAG: class I SAM-dependent DNA methyltransferase [Victivallales bacterium]|nr:class I SAM-dependent DNA methyltransferase [Victivallales bacterium]